MRITRISFSGQPRGGFLSYVRVEIDDCFALHEMKLVRKHDGTMLLAMPGRYLGEKMSDIFHPINQETRSYFEKAIFAAYENQLGKIK